MRLRSGDSEHRYRPDSELLYVTGLEEPASVVVLSGHADERRFAVFVQARDPGAEQWSGTRLGPDRAQELLGADAAYPIEELDDRLPTLLHGARAVYYRLRGDSRIDGLVRQALAWSRRRGARSGRGPRTVVDPGEILNELRLRKEPAELDRIRRAAEITTEGFRRLAARVAPGVGEWELEALLDGWFRASGGSGSGFASIVGSGINACVLHYVENGARLADGDLLLVDAGAEVDFYNADVTRTYPVSGSFSPEQRAVYDTVLAAQRAAIEAARPGQPVDEVHEAALHVIVDGLRDLTVLEGSRDEILESESYRGFYPHQTSHWLGLDVHDPGDYAADGRGRALEPGMVLTVEPGLYFHPDQESGGRFRGIGIRIEDDILVTAEGSERLTRGLAREADEVATLVATGPSAS